MGALGRSVPSSAVPALLAAALAVLGGAIQSTPAAASQVITVPARSAAPAAPATATANVYYVSHREGAAVRAAREPDAPIRRRIGCGSLVNVRADGFDFVAVDGGFVRRIDLSPAAFDCTVGRPATPPAAAAAPAAAPAPAAVPPAPAADTLAGGAADAEAGTAAEERSGTRVPVGAIAAAAAAAAAATRSPTPPAATAPTPSATPVAAATPGHAGSSGFSRRRR